MGLAGLEPAASSLSEMDGRALCYPAFSQVALIHEWHRDGVNRTHPHQTGCSRLLADPGPLRGQLMSSCLGSRPGLQLERPDIAVGSSVGSGASWRLG